MTTPKPAPNVVEKLRNPQLETPTVEAQAKRPATIPGGVGFHCREMSSGELELVLTIEDVEGSCFLSREMWEALGERAGWITAEQVAAVAALRLAIGLGGVIRHLRQRAQSGRRWAADSQIGSAYEAAARALEAFVQVKP